jgi:hypothetical protein
VVIRREDGEGGERVIEVPLTKGAVALIDERDTERVLARKWYCREVEGLRYAVTKNYPGPRLQMHRFILNAQPGECVDHINHNGLDNRRSNIRICTFAQNLWNQRPQQDSTSPFRGVHLCKITGRWRATIRVNGKRQHLGYYDSPGIAAMVYDEMAKRLYGEFACLNLPEAGRLALSQAAATLNDSLTDLKGRQRQWQ